MTKKIKNKKGFSMVELLLALLIISIVLAASMPTVVRSAKSGRENIWHWLNANTSAYFGKNSSQKLLIGLGAVPTHDIVDFQDLKPELNGKVSVLKSEVKDAEGNPLPSIITSHIDLLDSDGNYSARIAASPTNIAFGNEVLVNVAQDDPLKRKTVVDPADPEVTTSFNTGIGNEVLQNVDSANANTGIGFGALNHNLFGNNNTAVGAYAGEGITGGEIEDSDTHEKYTGGSNNTLIGYDAGAEYAEITDPPINIDIPDSNTIVGTNACNNTLYKNAQRNICIGYNVQNVKQNSSDLLLIGSNTKNSSTYTPLITGHTGYSSEKYANGNRLYDKDIEFNVSEFNIKPFDGSFDVFSVKTNQNEYASTSTLTMKYYIKSTNVYTGIKFYADNISSESASLKMDIKSAEGNPTLNVNYGALRLTFKKDELDEEPYPEISTTSSMTIKAGDDSVNSSIKLSNEGLNLYSTKTAFSIYPGMDDPGFKIDGGNEVNFKGKSIDLDSNNVTIRPMQNRSLNIKPKLKIHDGLQIDGEYPSISAGGVSLKDGIIKADMVSVGQFNSHSYLAAGGGLWDSIDKLKNRLNEVRNSYYGYPSDLRLKNIKGDSKAGLKEIEKIKVKNFTFKNDETQEKHVGVIAQDLKKIFPNSVSKGKDGYLQIKTDEIFYAACNAVKELYAKFLDLTAKVTGLDERLTALKKENAQLKAKSLEFEKRLDKLEAEN